MKKAVSNAVIICFISCFALILSGCTKSIAENNLGDKLANVNQNVSENKADNNKAAEPPAAKAEKETEEAKAQSPKLPQAIKVSANPADIPEGELVMTVLTDPDSDEFKAHAKNALRHDPSGKVFDFSEIWYDRAVLEDIIFIAERDLILSFENVYFEPGYYMLLKYMGLSTLNLKKGQSVCVPVYLTEGTPDFRAFAFAGGDMSGNWYNSYDGSGENTHIAITADPINSGVVNYKSATVNLAAALIMSMNLNETYEYYAWGAIAHAITMDMGLYFGDEEVVIPAAMVDFYRKAMFPDVELSDFPKAPDLFMKFDAGSQTYTMDPFLYGDVASWKCVGIDNNIGGDGCSVLIDIYCPEIIEMYYPDEPERDGYIRCGIVFGDNSSGLDGNPFAYQIEEIIWMEDDENYRPYYEFMRSDEWKKYMAGDGNTYIDEELEYLEYILVDIDGNGIKELWLKSKVWGSIFPHSISGIYTISENGTVEKIISGYETGGSIGGDWVDIAYDSETDSYLPALHGHVGGFGGNGTYDVYYTIGGFSAGIIIADVRQETINDITAYYIYEEECSEEEFYERLSRFTVPEYDQYIFPEE